MGCDIHLHVEYRTSPTSEWRDGNLYAHTGTNGELERVHMDSESRHYELFTALANVRGSGGMDPRGVPNDITKKLFVELGGWEGDAHSHSYFTLEELLVHLQEYSVLDQLVSELKRYHGTLVSTYARAETYNNIRIVFWFDS